MKDENKKYILENIGKKTVKEIARSLGMKEKKIRNFLEKHKKNASQVKTVNASVVERPAPFGMKSVLSKKVFLVIIFLVGFAVYSNSFQNEFLFDDIHNIQNNEQIRNTGNIVKVFQQRYGTQEGGGFYRPILTLTYMWDYFLWKLQPIGYHITNILLHILVCLLIFEVICIITESIPLSGIITLLYLVHPVHTEAVTYMSGRGDSLCAIFLFLIIILQYRYWSCTAVKKVIYYTLMLIVFVCALFSKELALIFPFLLMFFEYCMRDRGRYTGLMNKRLTFYIPFFLVSGLWFLLKNRIVPTETMTMIVPSLSARLTVLPRLIFDYLRLSFIPMGLHMEYKYPAPASFFDPRYFGPFLFIIVFCLIIYQIWQRGKVNRNYRIMFFGLGWFLIGLIPYMNILFVLNALFAEHWLYIPEMGFLLFIIYLIFYYLGRKTLPRRMLVGITSIWIVFYCCLTVSQNMVWKDAITFYTHTIRLSPYSAKAYGNLAIQYGNRGNLMKAKELLERAVKIDPMYEPAKADLARLNAFLAKKKR